MQPGSGILPAHLQCPWCMPTVPHYRHQSSSLPVAHLNPVVNAFKGIGADAAVIVGEQGLIQGRRCPTPGSGRQGLNSLLQSRSETRV